MAHQYMRRIFHGLHKNPAAAPPQARNQEFVRAGEVSENKGTSTNI